jgi:HAD superfamily hydrolase (TIGR01490 family)
MVGVEPHPRRVAAFFDVDRTLVRGSSMLALAGPLRRAGLLPLWTVVSVAVRGRQFSTRGFTEEEIQRAVCSVSATVRGMDAAELRRVTDRAIPRVLGPRVYDEALRLIAWHRARNHLVFLVSASTHDLIDKLGEIVGANGVVASEAEIVSGHYTGTVALCHGTAKAEAVRRLAETHGIDLQSSYAYGDAAGDIPMLQAVGHPIAVNPDRRLRMAAQHHGWRQLHFRSQSHWTWWTGPRRPAATVRPAAPHRPGDVLNAVVTAEASSDGAGTPAY